MSGVRLARLEVGNGREAYPVYSPAQASPTQLVGASVLGEARVGRHLLAAIGGGTTTVFRGVGRETGHGFAGALQASGIGIDATLSATHAGGAFPFRQADADGGVRPVLRFPVSFAALPGEHLDARAGAMLAITLAHRRSGAPTLLAFAPDANGGIDGRAQRGARTRPRTPGSARSRRSAPGGACATRCASTCGPARSRRAG